MVSSFFKTIFLLTLFLVLPFKVNAQVRMPSPEVFLKEVRAQAYLVADAKSGEVFFQKNSKDVRVPASLTKVLSAMVVLDLKPDMKKLCTLSSRHEVGGSRIAARNGTRYKLGDLLDASLVASANNATVAMADCVSNRNKFVQLMNEKAKSLGAENSKFFEPSGIDVRNTTSAEDMFKILLAGFQNPEIQEISQKAKVTFSSASSPVRNHVLRNTNMLLGKGLEVVSAKTGYLNESGYNFAVEVKNLDQNVIVILLGSPTKAQSFSDARVLLKSAEVRSKEGVVSLSAVK